MRIAILFTGFFALSLEAGPLLFSPDSICAGTGTGCKYSTVVHNRSKDTVLSTLTLELSAVSVGNRVGIKAVTGSPGATLTGPVPYNSLYVYGVAFDSIASTPKGYSLRYRSWERTYSIHIGPGDSLTLLQVDVGSPLNPVARPSRRFLASRNALQAANPTRLGSGEWIGLVFTSDKGGSDTLHVRTNEWLQPAGIRPRTRVQRPLDIHFGADGRPSAPQAIGIQVGPDGAHPSIR